VGYVTHPWLVLPLTVEPQTHFSLDTLDVIPDCVYCESFMSKSMMNRGTITFYCPRIHGSILGLNGKVGGLLVSPSPLDGSKVGLGPTNFVRNLGIVCSLYIDECRSGELFVTEGYWSCPISQRDQEFSFQTLEAALFVVVTVLVHLGYFLGLKKCVFVPVTSIVHLGMLAERASCRSSLRCL